MVNKKITCYNDLDVYQRSYRACVDVMTKILTNLPQSEKYDLKDQLSRSSKAIPRLIAEGFAKKHQKKGFQKYLDDAMAESNETQVGLCQCRDIYSSYVNIELCKFLINEYDIIGRQIYKLKVAWNLFTDKPKP